MSLPVGSWRLAALLSAALALEDALGREQVRVYGLALQPLPLVPVALALLAAGLLLPERAWPRPGAAALALYVALFALWGLGATRGRSAPDSGRLQAAWRALPSGESGAAVVRLEQLATPRGLFEACGRRGALELELQGVLGLPESGRYGFTADCGGECQLFLGGALVARGAGRVAATSTQPAGPQPLRLVLRQPGERAFVTLAWDRPAAIEAGRLADALGVERAGDILGRQRAAFGRAALQGLLAALATLLSLTLLARLRGARARLVACAQDPVLGRAALLAVAAAAFLLALHALAAPLALPGGGLQAWTSEYMMQTVSVADLRIEPLRSLYYLHIQPPVFDALRAALVALQPAGLDGEGLMQAVDCGLFVAWGLAYACAVALVYVFVARQGRPRAALAAALLFACHPAVLFYATFLDSTFLSALLVTWLGYELSRIGPGRGSASRLALAVLALFFTRSLVQWPFLPLLALALALRGLEPRRLARALAACALVMGLFLAKQYALFGLTITSSFGPDSFCKGLSAYCRGTTPVAPPHALPAPGDASALRRTAKLNGEYNYNQLAFLARSFAQMAEYRELLRSLTPGECLRLMAHNLDIWLRPSSRHSAHVLVDRLPWRGPFDLVMSGIPLVALLLGATGIWLRGAWGSRPALLAGLGLLLPVLYFAATSIVFESGENMRYKFFVEPLLWVFVWSQGAALFTRRTAA